MAQRFTVSAPGKIILSGEHSVVYGYKAIATSINLRCYANVDLTHTIENSIILNLKSIPFIFKVSKEEIINLQKSVQKYNDPQLSNTYQSVINDFIDEKCCYNIADYEYIKSGIGIFLDLYLQTFNSFKSFILTITSEFSYGCGIGSSAAYSTVIATSLLIISNSIELKKESIISESFYKSINELALRGEKIVHGTPSGIDNSISLYGKCVVFQKKSLKILREIPKLKVILIDTGVKRCTRSVVKAVRKLVDEDRDQYHDWFSKIHKISEQFERILMIGNYNTNEMNKLIEENQQILRKLNVSHSTIEEIIDELKSQGISGKLTGAGWGGCVYGLIPVDYTQNDQEILVEKLSSKGYRSRLTSVCCDGVQINNDEQ